jgi:hydrogenase maturation protease
MSPRHTDWHTVVAGFGSPHGDDQAGWRVAAMLSRRPNLPARVVAAYEPLQILQALRGCERLIVVDACHTGGSAGVITRLTWPDPRIAVRHRQSSHGVGVFDVLKLAEKLGDLPPVVEIIGIEAVDWEPGSDLGPDVLQSVAEVEALIADELREVTHA